MAPLGGRGRWLLAVLLALALLATACGSDSGDERVAGDGADSTASSGAVPDVSERGDPVYGGSITLGLEAEANSWPPGTGDLQRTEGRSVGKACVRTSRIRGAPDHLTKKN